MRAGLWARSVCTKEGLELGTMLPFLDVCQKKHIPVLVMNPNVTGTMDEHALHVWKTYVAPSGFD